MNLVPQPVVQAVLARAAQVDNPMTEETIEFVYDECLTERDALEKLVEAHGYNAVMQELWAAMAKAAA